MTTQTEALSYWHAALGHPLGIYLRTPDRQRLVNVLNNARAAARDPSLSTLTLRTSPTDPSGEVWIIRTQPNGHPSQITDVGVCYTLNDFTDEPQVG